MGYRKISVSAARPRPAKPLGNPGKPWETLGNPGKPWEIPLFHGPKGGRVDECQGAGLSCTLFEQVFE